jgi:copper resistance protein B
MKSINIIVPLFSVMIFWGNQCVAGAKDDPMLVGYFVDQFELRDADGQSPFVMDAQAWIGQDLNKLWFKSELERVDGETEEAELQALYSKGISTYWDFQIGVRRDFKPIPTRNWAVLGFQGLAPYFFEIDTALFIGEEGRSALRLEAEYEILFTQKLILSPEVSVNFYGKDDLEIGIGKGLSDTEFGARLRYEIRREFAPYIGINNVKKYGRTKDIAQSTMSDTVETQVSVGIKAWY